VGSKKMLNARYCAEIVKELCTLLHEICGINEEMNLLKVSGLKEVSKQL